MDINTVKLTEEVIRQWLSFSKYDLDEQFLTLPMQINRLSKECAYLISIRDRLKQALEVVRAEVYSKVRKEPAKYNVEILKGDKPSERAIESAIVVSVGYSQAQEKLIRATEDLAIMEAGRSALKDKQYAMTYEYKMWENGYFADGKLPRMSREGKDASETAIRERQQSNLQNLAEERKSRLKRP